MLHAMATLPISIWSQCVGKYCNKTNSLKVKNFLELVELVKLVQCVWSNTSL